MAECPRIKTCPFFNDSMKDMPALTTLYKINYCMNHFENCARYLVAQVLGQAKVPGDLLPNQKTRAEHVITHA